MGSQFCRHSPSHPAAPLSSLLPPPSSYFCEKWSRGWLYLAAAPRRRTRSPQFQVGYGDIQRVLCSPPISLRTSRRLGGRELGTLRHSCQCATCNSQNSLAYFGLNGFVAAASASQAESTYRFLMRRAACECELFKSLPAVHIHSKLPY